MATITRTAMVDDDGTGTTGTIINNAWKTEFYNQIDAAFGPAVIEQTGTYTPSLQATSSSGQVYSIRDGRYIKIGHLVYVTGRVALSNKGTMSGGMVITLPFVASAVGEPFVGMSIGYFAGLAMAVSAISGYVGPASAGFYLLYSANATLVSQLTDAAITNTTDFMFGGTYYAA
jgi:hypothetical protein